MNQNALRSKLCSGLKLYQDYIIHCVSKKRFERRNVHEKKQTCTKTETYKLYSRVFRIFLPNVIKIDPYNFELYRFKVCTFFWDTVYKYIQTQQGLLQFQQKRKSSLHKATIFSYYCGTYHVYSWLSSARNGRRVIEYPKSFKFTIANALLFASSVVSLFTSFWWNLWEGNEFCSFLLASRV